ncbi:hypothetical protein HNY73_015146 [Argiope bruennichi]|uniref:Uncharacterized protein n=1 Tax=Argiope bruennichi TaxID=94029 RepID=A0A8T0ER75_ARGBR|nr:hypothetical protein HNY73_015146 [Argiope bruennichi]
MKYGQENEVSAIRAIEENFNLKVDCFGLFVNPDFPYLAASPDGLIGDDGIVELLIEYMNVDVLKLKYFFFHSPKVFYCFNSVIWKHKGQTEMEKEKNITKCDWCKENADASENKSKNYRWLVSIKSLFQCAKCWKYFNIGFRVMDKMPLIDASKNSELELVARQREKVNADDGFPEK